MNNKCILTIATGKKVYVDMAVNLARSFWLWNSETDIRFCLATDQPQHLPDDIKAYVKIIPVKPGELGDGFSPKLHLDRLAPGPETLFIDSDCLIYGNIEPVFEKFAGRSVSVVGGYISSGEWFGNVAEVCKKFNIGQLPKFNGGIYYIEKGEKAAKVYQTARRLEAHYDDIGFIRFRNHPADEQLMSLAMALNGEQPIADDATIMSDPQACPGRFSTNVLKGKAHLYNPPAPNPSHRYWYPFEHVQPLIVHFLGHHSASYQYRKDVYLLKQLKGNKLNSLYSILGFFYIELPARVTKTLKYLLRPVYKFIFGARHVKQSGRL